MLDHSRDLLPPAPGVGFKPQHFAAIQADPGPVGWFDASGNGEFGIALRCAQLADDARSARLFAGCGLVVDSDPAAEWQECLDKAAPIVQLTPQPSRARSTAS